MRNRLTERDLSRIVKRVINESEKRKLVFESIMQTINEYGLHGAVGRSLLTEGDAPDKKFVFPDFDYPYEDTLKKMGVKYGGIEYETDYGPLAYQSSTSLAEAQQIIQELITILSKSGTDDGPLLAKALGKITINSYYMLLWKVRYGSSFKSITKSNYNTITDWISKKGMDIPSTKNGSPFNAIRNWFQDPTVFNAVNRLRKYNHAEGRDNSMDLVNKGGTAL